MSLALVRGWNFKLGRLLIGLAFTITITISPLARATRCIEPIPESIPIEIVEVRQGDQVVEMSDELKGYDRLNGDSVSMSLGHADWQRPNKYFRMVERIAPTPAVDCFISAVRQARTRGRCRLSFDAIVPGKYVFEKEGSYGKTSSSIDARSILINAQRDRLDLQFDLGGRRYVAEYRLKRSSHHDEFFIACPDEPRPQQAAPIPGHSGCAACSLVGGNESSKGSMEWVGALLLTSFLHRRRSRRSP